MRRFVAASLFLAVLASGSLAWAQGGGFRKGETVYFKYVGEWREGKVKKDQDQSGVLVSIKNALTGQWGDDAMYKQPGELRRDKPADFDEEGYGNAPAGLQGPMANAQFQPGQLVRFPRGGGFEDGIVVKQTREGVLIKYRNWATGQFDGDFQAFHPADTVALGPANGAVPNPAVNPQPQPQPQPGPAVNPQPQPQPQPQPNPAVNPQPQQPANPGGWEPPLNMLPQTPDGPAMTENDVLGFLNQKLGPDPFAPAVTPQREQVFKELEAMVLKRGLTFTHNDALSDFGKALIKFGTPNGLNSALALNRNAPLKTVDWYQGTWGTFAAGNPETRDAAGFTGDLQILPDGKYIWNHGNGVIEGNWRPATELEMNQGHKGGSGVVLLKAKQGFDFIVQEDDQPVQGGENIWIGELKGRNMTESAGRMQ